MPARLHGAIFAILCLCSMGCGSDEEGPCGPGELTATGVTITIPGQTIRYDQFTSSANNDCTPTGGPTSLTLDGIQVDPMTDVAFSMAFCLPRPVELSSGTVSLADDRLIELIDVRASLEDGCRLDIDRSIAPTATITFQGYCQNGLHPDGYAIELSGTTAGFLVCDDGNGGSSQEPVTLTFGGAAVVEALSL